jgi:hypothetical protein
VNVQLRVVGAKELAASLNKAAREVADLHDGFDEAGRIASAAGQSTAPRRTGRLAGSVRANPEGRNSTVITAPVVYAVPIHWGRPAHHIEANPFLVRGVDRSESQWLAAIEADAQRVCDQVKGA